MHVGSFLAADDPGAGHGSQQVVTGLCFQPKALLFFSATVGGGTDADGYSHMASMHWGMASGVGEYFCWGWDADDNVNTSLGHHYSSTDYAYRNALAGQFVLSGFDAGGFTIEWTPFVTNHPLRIYYVAWGGDDLSAHVDTFATPSSASDFSVTGCGFQPDFALFGTTLHDTVGDGTQAFSGFGAASSTTEQLSWGIQSFSFLGVSDDYANFKSDKCTTGVNPTLDLALLSFDTDGYTFHWRNASTSISIAVGYLALKCASANFKVGYETQKTSIGTKATTGVGFKPRALIASGVCRASTDAIEANSYATVGAARSITQAGAAYEGAVWAGSTGGLDFTNTDARTREGIVLSHSHPYSNTDAEASMSSWDSDGFTLDWTTADSSAREFFYVAMDSVDNPCGTRGQIIRYR